MVQTNLSRNKILIVNENSSDSKLLKDILSDAYDIIESNDTLEGLDILKKNFQSLSLVFLDMDVGDKAFDFLNEYVKVECLSMIPVIAVAQNGLVDEEKCLLCGASDFIKKPYIKGVVLSRAKALVRLKDSISLLQVVKYDELTKIFTKNVFCHYAEEKLKSSDEQHDILLVNIEDFSYLNDIFGEKKCDDELVYIAKSIIAISKDDYIFGRLGADRFAILWPSKAIGVDELVNTLKNELDKDSPIKNISYKFCYYENVEHDIPIHTLINRLSATIKKIKNQYNVDMIGYNKAQTQEEEFNKFIIENMESALNNGEFKVYYQPKHNIKTNELVGAEALVRWISPQRGIINPGKFISIFEENGFITKLDLFVLEKVCQDIKIWLNNGIKVVPISVNASKKDVVNIEKFASVVKILEKYNIPKEYIHIEITESMYENSQEILNKIKVMHDTGIKIELDDFGAGYSSLGMLTDIPMDYIKLDMKFARNIKKQKKVVKMIIALAHSMKVLAIAEGVETKEQYQIFKRLGCDYIQGYYYSQPLSYDEFWDYMGK